MRGVRLLFTSHFQLLTSTNYIIIIANFILTSNLSSLTSFSGRKAVYNPKAVFPHAASLGQAFAHCRRFSTAATRRCEARISMPPLGVTLSRPLPVIALVSHYLTNKLIGREPISERLLRAFTGNRFLSTKITQNF